MSSPGDAHGGASGGHGGASGGPSSKRLLILIGIALVLFVAVLLSLFVGPKSTPTAAPVTAPSVPVVTTPEPAPTPPISQQVEQQARTASSVIQADAKAFTERYGSFSTEAQYANLRDVMPLMTSAFAAQTERLIATFPAATEYYGVTTRAVSVTVSSLDEKAGTAAVTIGTQRSETKGSARTSTVRYQDFMLTFQMVGTDWKVSSATWQ